jgi:hypothetical protein
MASLLKGGWPGDSLLGNPGFSASAIYRLQKNRADQGLCSSIVPHLRFRANYGGVMPKPVDLDYDPNDVEMRQITVRMPADLYEAVKQRAAKDMRPVAQAMRFALREYARS